ncbi:MAG: SprT family zinc-dependent metalloprotease [Polyangiales bacterium]
MDALAEITWGTTRIAYALSRSSRQKTLSIRVEPDGRVEVVAPAGLAEDRIEAVVRKKAGWIVERQRELEDLLPRPSPREFVSGETFLYLGRQYLLRVKAGSEPSVKLLGKHLEVTVPRGTSVEGRADVVRDQLVGWYRAHAEERLPERVEVWAKKLGVTPRSVLVREPAKRWGSCDVKGNVRINWRVVQAPMRLVDYVVAHELVHLVHADHGKAFWATLGRVMPDYEGRRDCLRRRGEETMWR